MACGRVPSPCTHRPQTTHARAALIRDAVAADPTKFFTLAQFDPAIHDDLPVTNQPGLDSAILGLTAFAERRAAALATQLP